LAKWLRVTDPLSLDVLMGEFAPDYEAWVLRDARSGLYLTIPHPKYPGRIIVHFFMSRENAMSVLDAIIEAGNKKIEQATIIPVKVNLHASLQGIAKTKAPGVADGFVVHPPNEVYEFLRDLGASK
jgi:hypothetical protein